MRGAKKPITPKPLRNKDWTSIYADSFPALDRLKTAKGDSRNQANPVAPGATYSRILKSAKGCFCIAEPAVPSEHIRIIQKTCSIR